MDERTFANEVIVRRNEDGSGSILVDGVEFPYEVFTNITATARDDGIFTVTVTIPVMKNIGFEDLRTPQEW